eukprot:04606_2
MENKGVEQEKGCQGCGRRANHWHRYFTLHKLHKFTLPLPPKMHPMLWEPKTPRCSSKRSTVLFGRWSVRALRIELPSNHSSMATDLPLQSLARIPNSSNYPRSSPAARQKRLKRWQQLERWRQITRAMFFLARQFLGRRNACSPLVFKAGHRWTVLLNTGLGKRTGRSNDVLELRALKWPVLFPLHSTDTLGSSGRCKDLSEVVSRRGTPIHYNTKVASRSDDVHTCSKL